MVVGGAAAGREEAVLAEEVDAAVDSAAPHTALAASGEVDSEAVEQDIAQADSAEPDIAQAD